MAEYAYACRPCDGRDVTWFVGLDAVAQMPADTQVVQVRVGSEWRCAILDRSRKHVVEGMLVREVIAAGPDECPECYVEEEEGEEPLVIEASAQAGDGFPTPQARPAPGARRTIQAAAISLGGKNLVVVAARMDLVRDAVEADLVIDDLSEKLGGVPVVLMAQREDDGSPAYYGDSALVDLLAGVPLDRMPWREYPLG